MSLCKPIEVAHVALDSSWGSGHQDHCVCQWLYLLFSRSNRPDSLSPMDRSMPGVSIFMSQSLLVHVHVTQSLAKELSQWLEPGWPGQPDRPCRMGQTGFWSIDFNTCSVPAARAPPHNDLGTAFAPHRHISACFWTMTKAARPCAQSLGFSNFQNGCKPPAGSDSAGLGRERLRAYQLFNQCLPCCLRGAAEVDDSPQGTDTPSLPRSSAVPSFLHTTQSAHRVSAWTAEGHLCLVHTYTFFFLTYLLSQSHR